MKCGCWLEHKQTGVQPAEPLEIIYCPKHAAVDDMLAALEAIQLRAANSSGWTLDDACREVGWIDDECRRVLPAARGGA